jgi:hypothetical protein
MSIEERLAWLEGRVAKLEAERPNILGPVPGAPISWPDDPVKIDTDPCAGCGPICHNAFCPKRMIVSYDPSTGQAVKN